jgi:CubicO group peptidase (beta-lactamase class C family)
VVLALLIEAVSARSYYEVVQERVCAPSGLRDTAFLRVDQLPASAAIGYLPTRGWRSNEHLVPARGGGDGGAYTSAADLTRLWQALHAGQIVPRALLAEMLRPQQPPSTPARGYGLGFWLVPGLGAAFIEGSDAGISFRSWSEPVTGLRWSVLSNTTRGAWPIVKELEAELPGQLRKF